MHHRDALAGLAACLVGRWQRRPAGLPLVERVRTVGLGHPVDVHDPRSQLAHPGDHRWARRGTGHGRDQLPAERVRLRGTGDQRQYRRRAVEMGHPLVVEELPDHVGAHRPQAHVRGADRRDRPRCAPPVAVEHRQRPQVDALRVQPLVDDLAQRVEVRAAVGVHHTLGRAGRPRGVVDRDQALLVVDRPGQRLIRAAFQELVVGDVRERGGVRWGRAEGIVDGHDQRDAPQPVQHRGQRGQVLGVDHQQRRPGVVADVADLLRGEPGVDRYQHRACQWHAEVGHQHLGDVRAHVGDAVAALHAGGAQGVRESSRLGGELAVARAAVPVGDRGLVGEDIRGAREEAQRGQ